MTNYPGFTHLVRFANSSGNISYGEAAGKELTKDGLIGQCVRIFKGNNPWDPDFTLTAETQEIAEVLRTVFDSQKSLLTMDLRCYAHWPRSQSGTE